MEDISRRSGESIENILNFYKHPEDEDYDFRRLFDVYISDYKWEKIFNIYDIGSTGEACIIEITEEDNDNESLNNLTDAVSKTKSLDEMEDEYWSLVEEKNSYDVLDEVNIIRNDEEENKNNGLKSADNEVTIIEFEEEIEQVQEEVPLKESPVEDEKEEAHVEKVPIKETKVVEDVVEEELLVDEAVDEEEITNVNYLSKIKEAKELLDSGAITQQKYDELKWKYLDLI